MAKKYIKNGQRLKNWQVDWDEIATIGRRALSFVKLAIARRGPNFPTSDCVTNTLCRNRTTEMENLLFT
jgi:hypothetical protein